MQKIQIFTHSKYSLKNYLHKQTNSFYRYYTTLLSIVFLIRVIETIYISNKILFESSVLSLFVKGLLTDIVTASYFTSGLLLITLMIPVQKSVFKYTIHTLQLLFVVIQYTCVQFFINALVPLDHSLFTYSVQELLMTIKSTSISIFSHLLLLFLIVIYFLVFKYIPKRKQGFLISLPILLISIFFLPSFLKTTNKKNRALIERQIILNKAEYFLYSSAKFLTRKSAKNVNINKSEILQFIQTRKSDNFYSTANNVNNEKNIEIEIPEIWDYPLLHVNNYNPLKPYFKSFQKKPNLVFIIVESLDRRFFYTNDFCNIPFLDSLRKKSLYWNNLYSTSERTFGALPSIFGSLPYGTKGFTELEYYPAHQTTLSILKNNGYYTSFFYGGWLGFQGMQKFLTYQNLDYYIHGFPSDYKKIPETEKGRSWGYSDGETMRRSIEIFDSVQPSPFVNIYLTLSTHSPFKIPNRKSYLKKLHELTSKLNDQQKENILHNADAYISILYADDCIKWLIEKYKQRVGYEETIFIITGDHGMHEIHRQQQIDIYGVPLIIFSPLLTKAHEFSQISSHLDITPSILNLLEGAKAITKSDISHWMSYGFDTISNPKFIPFMKNNKDISECIYNNYFFSDNLVYRINSPGNIELIKDSTIKNQIVKRLSNFKNINQYVTLNYRILPSNYLLNNAQPELLTNLSDEHTDNFNIKKKISFIVKSNKSYTYQSLTLEKDYEAISVDLEFNIQYSDTLPNPIWAIRIFNENNNPIDYFYLKNSLYTNEHKKIQEWRTYYFSRTIKDSNNLFKKGNKLRFEVYNTQKNISIKNISLKLNGLTFYNN